MRGVDVGGGGKGVRTGDSWGQRRWKVLQMEVGDGCTAVCKHERHRAGRVDMVRMGNSMFCVFYIKKNKSTAAVQQGLGASWTQRQSLGDRNTGATAKDPGGGAVSTQLLETRGAP